MKKTQRLQNAQSIFTKLYFDQLENGMLLFSYRGDFRSEANFQLIEMLENRFLDKTDSLSTHIEWFHVMVEMLQNISNHGKKSEGEVPGYFGIQLKDGRTESFCWQFREQRSRGKSRRLFRWCN